jgi:hypothetical protein
MLQAGTQGIGKSINAGSCRVGGDRAAIVAESIPIRTAS